MRSRRVPAARQPLLPAGGNRLQKKCARILTHVQTNGEQSPDLSPILPDIKKLF